jgi:hypothetical protein
MDTAEPRVMVAPHTLTPPTYPERHILQTQTPEIAAAARPRRARRFQVLPPNHGYLWKSPKCALADQILPLSNRLRSGVVSLVLPVLPGERRMKGRLVPSARSEHRAAQKDHRHAFRLSGVYRVATLEDRITFLVNTFTKPDFERQQQLLAFAGALTNGRTTGD